MYVTHCRYFRGDGLLDPFREAIDIGAEAGVSVQISHFHSPVDGMGERMIGLIDEGRNRGVDVTFDQYPYPRRQHSPPLHDPALGPTPEARPSSWPASRTPEYGRKWADKVNPTWGGDMSEYIFSQIGSAKNKEWEGRSLEDLARAWDKVHSRHRLRLADRREPGRCIRGPHRQPRQHTHHPPAPRADGRQRRPAHGQQAHTPEPTAPSPYLRGQLVRDEGIVSLEDAIRKMTSIPAQRLGLDDRGILRNGMKADIVVFNPDTVQATATFEEPEQFPIGIYYVIVNGKLVIDQGDHTGALPGRALRHS